MPAPPKTKTEAILGYGTKIEFIELGFIGRGTNFRASRGSVDTVEITNFDSPQPEGDNQWGGAEFVPTFPTGKTLSLTVIYTPDQKLPAEGYEGTVRVTFPLKAGWKTPEVWSGAGILTGVDVSAETRGAFSAEVTIQKNGVWTRTAPTRNA